MIRSNVPTRAIAVAALVVMLTAACGTGAPGGSQPAGPTPLPTAGTFLEFTATFCPALQGMLRAIGNPDTASDSELSAALDEAIKRGNLQDVDVVARQIQVELEGAHRLATAASAWPPGSTAAVQLDRLLGAFSAMIEAKRAAASLGLPEAEKLASDALNRAGGQEAWTGMLEGMRGIPELGRADAPKCA